MNICKYCNGNAIYPPKTKWGGWCCKDRFYDCPGYKKKLSENSYSWNKGLTKETNEKLAELATKAKGIRVSGFTQHTAETKKLISERMKGNRNANHRGDRQSYYKDIRMDSSWEVKTAKYFDEQSIEWKYSERGYKLSDGRYYYPDFFIYENNQFVKLIEVKGYFREANKLKFEMFLKEYPDVNIELWMKQQLKDRKII
jgi:hypothetical protein